MPTEIWGVNVLGNQGVNVDNDFAVLANDEKDDVIVRINQAELTGAEFEELKDIAGTDGKVYKAGKGISIIDDTAYDAIKIGDTLANVYLNSNKNILSTLYTLNKLNWSAVTPTYDATTETYSKVINLIQTSTKTINVIYIYTTDLSTAIYLIMSTTGILFCSAPYQTYEAGWYADSAVVGGVVVAVDGEQEIWKSLVSKKSFRASIAIDETVTATVEALNAEVNARAAGDAAEANARTEAIAAEANIRSTQDAALAASINAITASIGQPNGIAGLDGEGKVPSEQLPSYVDDVVEGYYYDNKFYKDEAHTEEIPGEKGKIYVDLTTNVSYRWSGTTFVSISVNNYDALNNIPIINTDLGADGFVPALNTYYRNTGSSAAPLKWTLNETLIFPSSTISETITYVTAITTHEYINIFANGPLDYGGSFVYFNDTGWSDWVKSYANYKDITFTTAPSAEVQNWLDNNGTRQGSSTFKTGVIYRCVSISPIKYEEVGREVDTTVTSSSANLITSGAVYTMGTTLQGAIDMEASARQNADDNLQANIASEVNARTLADTNLQNNINTEIINRQNADDNLQSNINTLSNSLSNEITNRQNADANLQANIDTKQNQLTANNGLVIDNNVISISDNGFRINGINPISNAPTLTIVQPGYIHTDTTGGEAGVSLSNEISINRYGEGTSLYCSQKIQASPNVSANSNFELPAKAAGTYVLATTEDITGASYIAGEGINISNNTISISNNGFKIYDSIQQNSITVNSNGLHFDVFNGENGVKLTNEIEFYKYGSTLTQKIQMNPSVSVSSIYELPNKPNGTYTLATMNDITGGGFDPNTAEIRIGSNANVSGEFSIAIGDNAKGGEESVALGYNANSKSSWSTVLGSTANALGDDATALGYGAKAGYDSIALGFDAFVSGENSAGLGCNVNITSDYSIAIGYGSKVPIHNSIAIGPNASISCNEGIEEESFDMIAIGNGATAFGGMASAGQIAIGSKAYAGDEGGTIAMGTNAHAGGYCSTAIGTQAVAMGMSDGTIALGAFANVSANGAAQICEGTNPNANSLQFRNTVVVDGNGKINANTAQVANKVLDAESNNFLTIRVVTSMPASPDANTIYYVVEA